MKSILLFLLCNGILAFSSFADDGRGVTADEELATNAAVGTIAKGDPDLQRMIDSWAKGDETNGFLCAISFALVFENGSPVFYVNLVNTTTNYIRGILRIPFDGRTEIELLDSNGKPVPKTDAGKRVGVWSDRQIEDWFEKQIKKKQPRGIADILFPLSPATISNGISLPQLFQLKESGEYTLSYHLRMAQIKTDQSGKMGLNMFWMPGVNAKVQVRPEDISPPDSSPDMETNSSVK
jgi:hypothetical protein